MKKSYKIINLIILIIILALVSCNIGKIDTQTKKQSLNNIQIQIPIKYSTTSNKDDKLENFQDTNLVIRMEIDEEIIDTIKTKDDLRKASDQGHLWLTYTIKDEKYFIKSNNLLSHWELIRVYNSNNRQLNNSSIDNQTNLVKTALDIPKIYNKLNEFSVIKMYQKRTVVLNNNTNRVEKQTDHLLMISNKPSFFPSIAINYYTLDYKEFYNLHRTLSNKSLPIMLAILEEIKTLQLKNQNMKLVNESS